MFLSIIVPLYNEASNILPVLKSILKVQFPSYLEKYEIIVVDDKSTDDSYQIVSRFINEYAFIRLIRHEQNMGKGMAVHTGISNASGDVFLIQDADLELVPDDIPRLLDAMHNLKIGFVNGSRYLPGVVRPLSSFKRYLANRLFTFLTSIVINVKITDMACGYKLVRKDLYQLLILKEKRFGFEAELIIKAMRIKKNNIAEVPVQYFPRNQGEGKKFRNIDGLKILLTIFKYGLLRLN
jgi:glycosyltransferase involved in cell wall biosynthesis